MANEIATTTDVLTALKAPEMQRVLAEILRKSRLMQSSYVAQDAQGSAYCEGQRSLGIWLKKQIDKADPEAFARLIKLEGRNEHGHS